MNLPVAVAQFAANTDKEANRKLVTEAIEAAADAGAKLVVTPESGMYSDPTNSKAPSEYSEPLDGQFATLVAETARTAGITVVAGMVETVPGEERAWNTLLAVGPDGERIGVYRKLHLYDAFGYTESDHIKPGEHTDPLCFTIDGITFGAMTCYDVRFPEMARTLADAGAHAIVLPAAWAAGPAKEEHWSVLARARAIENTCYLLASGQTGPSCTGQSAVIDPMGTVLAGAGEQPGIAVAELRAERVEQVRATNPSLANRRFRVLAK